MAQSHKDDRAAARRAAKRASWKPLSDARRAGRVSLLAAASDTDDASRWPRDCSEMAQRIDREGGATGRGVPDSDREILARRLPVGALTRRDGSSVRPVFRDPANL